MAYVSRCFLFLKLEAPRGSVYACGSLLSGLPSHVMISVVATAMLHAVEELDTMQIVVDTN